MISIVESLDCGTFLQRLSESFWIFFVVIVVVALIGTLASLTLKFSPN